MLQVESIHAPIVVDESNSEEKRSCRQRLVPKTPHPTIATSDRVRRFLVIGSILGVLLLLLLLTEKHDTGWEIINAPRKIDTNIGNVVAVFSLG